MLKKVFHIALVSFVLVGFQGNSCRAQNDRKIDIGPDVEANLVVFFKKDVNSDEIFDFHRTVIGVPESNGTGFSSLPGMMSVVRIIISGHQGEAIEFKPRASDEEKMFVKNRVLESPIVFRVYENVVPNEIDDLPDTVDTNEKKLNETTNKIPTRKPSRVVITKDSYE